MLDELRDEFPVTHWSLVVRAGHGAGEVKRQALDSLLKQYLPALRSHLLSSLRIRSDQASEILQSFLADRVLEQDMLRFAEQGRGRFRAFLCVALNNFALNCLRKEATANRLSKNMAARNAGRRSVSPSPEPCETLDIAWARQVLGQAVEQMREHCRASARPDIWGVFEGRVLAPALGQAEPAPYAQLVVRFGFVSPAHASNVLITANRMFARILRRIIGAYERTEEEIEEELRDLRNILANSRAGTSG
jgi:DNA-directed RNA polymerase specialized sigma24 family protein